VRTTGSLEDVQTAINTFEKTLTNWVATSPQKSPSRCSPSKPSKKMQFLRKELMLTDFTAWDVDDRLHEVEAQFRALKDVMNSSLTDRKSQDEALELAKTRSRRTL
jgi:kinesin family protein C1